MIFLYYSTELLFVQDVCSIKLQGKTFAIL